MSTSKSKTAAPAAASSGELARRDRLAAAALKEIYEAVDRMTPAEFRAHVRQIELKYKDLLG